jgi:hypothetical protein
VRKSQIRSPQNHATAEKQNNLAKVNKIIDKSIHLAIHLFPKVVLGALTAKFVRGSGVVFTQLNSLRIEVPLGRRRVSVGSCRWH